MRRRVGLIEVDHGEVCVGVACKRPLRHAGGEFEKRHRLIPVDGLELEVVERRKAGTDAFGDPEVGIRRPAADMLVDVVNEGQDRRVPWNELCRVPRQVHAREIRCHGGDKEASADTTFGAFEVERRRGAPATNIGGTGRW